MKRVSQVVLAVTFLVGVANAEPGVYTDLGVISSTSNVYTTPDLAFNSNPLGPTVLWYRFSMAQPTGASGFYLDIDLFATGATGQADTEIGLYDSVGNMVANDDDDGHNLRSALTFGNTTSRTMPPDPFGFTNGVAHNGRDGNLSAGSYYWLAVSLFSTTHGTTNWNVTSTSTAQPAPVTVNFRTDAPVPEPASMVALGMGVAALLRRRRK